MNYSILFIRLLTDESSGGSDAGRRSSAPERVLHERVDDSSSRCAGVDPDMLMYAGIGVGACVGLPLVGLVCKKLNDKRKARKEAGGGKKDKVRLALGTIASGKAMKLCYRR